MANLTAKQEKFARLVAEGKRQSDAYKQAYDAEGMADNTIYARASELANDSKLSVRISEIMKENQQHLQYDTEKHFMELEDMRQKAETAALGKYNDPDYKTAIKAVELKGKLCGLYIDKHDHKVSGGFSLYYEGLKEKEKMLGDIKA